jgi:hypothetical protein
VRLHAACEALWQQERYSGIAVSPSRRSSVLSMTSLNVPERMNELSDGAIRAFNTTTVSRHGSILEIPVEAYFAIPGLQLGAVEEKLAVIVRANQELEKFHRGRAAATPTA